MDMRKYMGSAFLKVEDVEEGPRRVTIAKVGEGKFDKPVLTFDDSSRLSLNVTNSRALARAYGTDSRDWIGMEIELHLGTIEYQGQDSSAILVRPITPPGAARTVPKSPPEMDDEIPF
jgi:hypothetical protein